MQINEKIIKIIGSANIEEPLKIGTDYIFTATASCVSETTSDNHDGSYNLIYKNKMFGNLIVQEHGSTPIKCKVKGNTPSQKLRYAIHNLWLQNNEGMDFETFYEKEMSRIIKSVFDNLE